jgi:hypothetical protein
MRSLTCRGPDGPIAQPPSRGWLVLATPRRGRDRPPAATRLDVRRGPAHACSMGPGRGRPSGVLGCHRMMGRNRTRSRRAALCLRPGRSSATATTSQAAPFRRPAMKGTRASSIFSGRSGDNDPRRSECRNSSTAALPGERPRRGRERSRRQGGDDLVAKAKGPRRRSPPRPRSPGRASRCRRRAPTRCDPVVWHAQRSVSRRSRRQHSPRARHPGLGGSTRQAIASVTPRVRWAKALGGLRTNLVRAVCSLRWSARVRRW